MHAQSPKAGACVPGHQTSSWPLINELKSDLQEAGGQQHGAETAAQSSGSRASLAVQDRPSLASQVYTRQREDLLEAEREFLTQVTLKMIGLTASSLLVALTMMGMGTSLVSACPHKGSIHLCHATSGTRPQ